MGPAAGLGTSRSPHVVVAGVGGAGGHAVARIAAAGLKGIRLIAIDTDRQALRQSAVEGQVRLRPSSEGIDTRGPAAAQAADVQCGEIEAAVGRADLVFVVAGLGRTTGAYAAPVVAHIAHRLGSLVIAVVSKPFSFEGARRARQAEEGITRLREQADAVIVLPYDRIVPLLDRRTTLQQGFAELDRLMGLAVQAVSDSVTRPGFITVDLARLAHSFSGGCLAAMGIGLAEGEGRAQRAAEEALHCPLFGIPPGRARRVLVNVTGGSGLEAVEVYRSVDLARRLHPEAEYLIGAVVDDAMADTVRVTVIASES